MSSIFNRYVESGYFMTKTAWKKTIIQAINNFYCNDLMSRVTSVKPYNRFLKIHVDITLGPHILWKLSKEYPRFKGMAQVAVRLIGMLFSGKWLRKCCNCGETNLLLNLQNTCCSIVRTRIVLGKYCGINYLAGLGYSFIRDLSLYPHLIR